MRERGGRRPLSRPSPGGSERPSPDRGGFRKCSGAAGVAAAAVLIAGAGPAAAAQQACDPFGPASFRGQVPTPKQAIGIDLGERGVTAAESDAYVKAVDDASPRVVSGTAATSVQ